MDKLENLIKTGESSANILYLSESALNSLKKSDLKQKILDLNRKGVINVDLHKLFDQIFKLTSLENRKLRSELVITQNVKSRLERT